MFLVALLALTGAMASTAWSFAQQRSNERELVLVGRQFQTAIEQYRLRAKPTERSYPTQLSDLLRDERARSVQRDLRKVYVDPMTGQPTWGLIKRPDGGIVGVHSLSERAPLKRLYVAPGIAAPKGNSYREWRFIAADEADPEPKANPVPPAPGGAVAGDG